MNILLIAPASGHWRGISRKRLFGGKTFRFSMLSLLTVAALSPKHAKVRLVDEQVEDLPEDEDFDLVGITAMTALAPRAFELCKHFRELGIPVVMGGFHATLNPEETLEHADAIVTGPAQGAWERVCEDVEKGQLAPHYEGDRNAPFPKELPRHLLNPKSYQSINAILATLGCENGCKFCSINAFHKGKRYQRPIEEVAAEISTFGKGLFLFVDDNLTQDRDYTLHLCSALAPLNKRWAIQTSLSAAEDTELLDALQAGGCIGVFVGLETFNTETLANQDKEFNKPAQYREAVREFHRRGMFVEAGVIVGFDADDVSVFSNTLRMLDWIGIDAIQLAILTPLPGTPLFESMKERIVDLDWSHYDYRHAVYTPRNMEQSELQAGADWLIQQFYSPWRIARRIPRWVFTARSIWGFIYAFGLNLAYYGRVKRFYIRGYNPEKREQHIVANHTLAHQGVDKS